MNQLNSNTQHQKGKHLSFEERVIIQTRLKDNYSPNKIAAELGCSILFGRRVFLCPHYFYKIFSQKFYIFSSFVNSFFINSVFRRDFCNMLHFSLLNSPRSANLTAKNAKAPEAGQACFRGNQVKFYFAFGPRPYFFR